MALTKSSEVIVKVGAEGGSVTLFGLRTATGWLFSRDVMDQTPELLDEPWIERSSKVVDSWPAALGLLDEYPWYRLYPMQVHATFRAAVLEAVKGRYGANGNSARSRIRQWEALCRELQ